MWMEVGLKKHNCPLQSYDQEFELDFLSVSFHKMVDV